MIRDSRKPRPSLFALLLFFSAAWQGAQDLEGILRGLADSDPIVKQQAIDKLKSRQSLLDNPDARAFLIRLLADVNAQWHRYSTNPREGVISPATRTMYLDLIFLLRKTGDPRALPVLMDAPMRDGHVSVANIERFVETPSPVIALLEDGNDWQRSNAMIVLDQWHPRLSSEQGRRVCQKLFELAANAAANQDVRIMAVFGLQHYPDEQVVRLLREISVNDPKVHTIAGEERYLLREAAQEVLAKIESQ